MCMQKLAGAWSPATSFWSDVFAANSSAHTAEYDLFNTAIFKNPSFYHSFGGNAFCITGNIPVAVEAPAVHVLYPGPSTNFELTEFITDFFRAGSDVLARSTGDSNTISQTFDIYSKLCLPADPAAREHLTSIQFLTHGGTLDSSYWDFADGYSYVDVAAERGYATFTYDRLGSGRSEHPDPLQIVQVPVHIEIAHHLIQLLRTGSLAPFSVQKVVGIGHSLGSAITQGLAARYPDDFDALILTGHSAFHAGSGIGFAAAAQQIANSLPDRSELKGLANGYFAFAGVEQAMQFPFFYYPHFDMEVFKKQFHTRGTNALGETLTIIPYYVPVPEYTGPVLISNGQQDFFYCQGNCRANGGDVSKDALEFFFPHRDVEKSKATTVPNMGHNVNMHLGRHEVFDEMLGFVGDLGMGKWPIETDLM